MARNTRHRMRSLARRADADSDDDEGGSIKPSPPRRSRSDLSSRSSNDRSSNRSAGGGGGGPASDVDGGSAGGIAVFTVDDPSSLDFSATGGTTSADAAPPPSAATTTTEEPPDFITTTNTTTSPLVNGSNNIHSNFPQQQQQEQQQENSSPPMLNQGDVSQWLAREEKKMDMNRRRNDSNNENGNGAIMVPAGGSPNLPIAGSGTRAGGSEEQLAEPNDDNPTILDDEEDVHSIEDDYKVALALQRQEELEYAMMLSSGHHPGEHNEEEKRSYSNSMLDSNVDDDVVSEDEFYADNGSAVEAMMHGRGPADDRYGDHAFDNDGRGHDRYLNDASLALTLQEELVQQDLRKEAQLMEETASGRAWKFVEAVLEMHNRMNDTTEGNVERIGVGTVSVDDMVWQAERMFIQQEEFVHAHKPLSVDLGYHYTHSRNLDRIRTDGLLTLAERNSCGVATAFYHGSAYGDGIYAASNPYSHHGSYGDVGLLVARLRGHTLDPYKTNMLSQHPTVITTANPASLSQGANNSNGNSAAAAPVFQSRGEDSCIIDEGTGDESIVLRKSSQCIALVTFPATLIRPKESRYSGNIIVYGYHCKLQAVVDKFFNPGRAATVITGTSEDPSVVEAATPQHTLTARQRTRQMMQEQLQQQQQQQRQARSKRTTSTAASTSTPISNGGGGGGGGGGSGKKNPVSRFARALGVGRGQSRSNDDIAATGGRTTTTPSSSRKPRSRSSSSDPAMVTIIPNSGTHSPMSQSSTVAVPTTKIAAVKYTAPEWLHPSTSNGATNPNNSRGGVGECPLCNRDGGLMGTVRCSSCGVEFHLDCITEEVMRIGQNSCPCCEGLLGPLPGRSPSGTMTIARSPNLHCSAVSAQGSITIHYSMPAAVQKTFHEHPGQRHSGTDRTALVPCSDEGYDLLKRLQAAFTQGLTFQVGTSQTTKQKNSITWACIPHKTHPASGPPFGFPDPNYFDKCNAILDALGVPPASLL